jgi:hypothetical protein
MTDSGSDNLYSLGNRIVSLLERECDLYVDVCRILREEGKALGGASTEAIVLIVKAKQALLAEAELLEEMKRDAVIGVAGCLGLDACAITLSRLLEFVEGRQKDRLQSCCKKSLVLHREAQALNDRNRELLSSSLCLVSDLKNFIIGAASARVGYLDTGRANELTGRGRLLQREG